MTETKRGFGSLLLNTFILTAAVTLAQENVGRNGPATVMPAYKFDSTSDNPITIKPSTTTTKTTTPQFNTTTPHPVTAAHANTSTPPPTTQKTTTTTKPANTTTPPPPTTHNTTTTTKPTNTTTPPPPTPGPTAPTNLTLGTYHVTDGENDCIKLEAKIQVTVNNSKAVGTYIVQKKETMTYGICNKTTADMILSFTHGQGQIYLYFVKDEKAEKVYVSTINLDLTYSYKAGVQPYEAIGNKSSVQLFSMEISHSHSCTSESVDLGDGITIDFKQLRVQAFDFEKSGNFGPADLCKADQPNYKVAIAIGIILIILIVAAIIYYLWTRKKRTDGYQSL